MNEKYQQKLNTLQQELKKLQEAKKEHAKLIRNQAVHEKQLKTYQHELQEMKRIKVKFIICSNFTIDKRDLKKKRIYTYCHNSLDSPVPI